MVFKAFKHRYGDYWKEPVDYTWAYYNPIMKNYQYFACSLISYPDGSYKLEGPDEELKDYIDYQLKINDNQLDYKGSFHYEKGSEEYEKYHTKSEGNGMSLETAIVAVSWAEAVGFDDPMFFMAFHTTVSSFKGTKELDYSGSEYCNNNFVKVNSLEDVKRLDKEYEEKKAELESKKDKI